MEPEIIPPPAETKLTGIKVQRQADRGLSVRPVPQAARLKGVGLSWTPVAAGRIALLGDFGDEMWFIFHCNDHVGDVAITVRVDNPDGGKFEGSSTATCR